MKMFNKVVIIGTGLIGGSLGLAIKKKHLAGLVYGLSRHKKNARLAKKIGAVDIAGKNLKVVREADLIILATPIDAIIEISAKIKGKLKKDCIVIDVGSAKERIVAKLNSCFPNFVGCHPLAGSEKRGIANLGRDIFTGSICIVTPIALTNKKALNKVKVFWGKLGAKVKIISPKRHDHVLALTSHLPHAVAFALINSIPENFLALSSNGLKDVTRISGSEFNLWSQIFLSNRNNLLKAVSSFQSKLAALKLALENKDKKLLLKILHTANKKREKLG